MDALPEHVRAFLNPDFYPHRTADIRMIQTHISWVFLTGDYAYKLKKPLDLGFLDFSTLEKRAFYCRRELELNRRLAPAIYLEVLPVTREDSGYRLGGEADIVDYCLKMQQFDQHDLLDQRLAAGTFDPAWMDMLAADIATFHAHAETAPRESGGMDALSRHIAANFQVAEAHLGTALSETTLAVIKNHCREQLEKQAKAVAERWRQGHVRACHGDLHLKNITLFQGRPCVFDCIEFGDEFRMIDTMNDVAFLLMDCDARDRPDLGYRFLSRYLEHTGDYEGLTFLPLYLIYRACVRGKVACLLAEDPGIDEATRAAQLAEASHYFSLAESCVRRPAPTLFAIGGLSGSGKSHLALMACGAEHAVIIRSDATRKRLAGNHPDLPLYGRRMNKLTYEAMFTAGETALRAGFSVILDATFLRREDRNMVRRTAAACHAPCRLLWLEADEALLRERITRRRQADSDVSDADVAVLDKQLAAYRRPEENDIIFIRDSGRWPWP